MHAALQREVDQALATLATPIEDGGPVRAAIGVVAHEGKHVHRAYWAKNGATQREYFGPHFDYPRDAIRFANQVNERSGLPAIGGLS